MSNVMGGVMDQLYCYLGLLGGLCGCVLVCVGGGGVVCVGVCVGVWGV